jgi:hypothetical protein
VAGEDKVKVRKRYPGKNILAGSFIKKADSLTQWADQKSRIGKVGNPEAAV